MTTVIGDKRARQDRIRICDEIVRSDARGQSILKEETSGGGGLSAPRTQLIGEAEDVVVHRQQEMNQRRTGK